MKRRTVLLTSLLIGGPLMSNNSGAAEWEKSAGVSLSSYYSDTICFSSDDLVGRGAARVAPQVTPGELKNNVH